MENRFKCVQLYLDDEFVSGNPLHRLDHQIVQRELLVVPLRALFDVLCELGPATGLTYGVFSLDEVVDEIAVHVHKVVFGELQCELERVL